MIPHGVEVFVGLDPIDLRWGYHRLTGLVAERMGRDAKSGALFVFFGKRRDAMKVLFFDRRGNRGVPVLQASGCRYVPDPVCV
jgi:transposase